METPSPPRRVWTMTVGRVVLFYVSAALFGANVAVLVQNAQRGGSVVAPAVGAVAMTFLSAVVLVTSYRPGTPGGRGANSPHKGTTD